MKASTQAINMIKNFEKPVLHSYKCLSTEEFYTIGYGHYGVGPGLTITTKQAEDYLLKDLKKAENAVNKYQAIYNFNQNQFDALVSFAFNIGSISQLTARGHRTKDEISNAMVHYNKSSGKVIPGLTKRRMAEQMLFNTPIARELKTTSQLAQEVILGKWGKGKTRKIKLEAFGYNYDEIQAEVNRMLL